MSRATRLPWWTVCVIVLVAAEVGLRLFVVGYRSWVTRGRAESAPAAELTVLCVGDSLVFGSGASLQDSYPSQLERLLQQRWPKRDIRVINAGEPSSNSSRVLSRLPAQLLEFRPDVVLVLVGLTDWGNFQDVDIRSLGAPWSARLQLRLDQWLSHVYLYRLGTLVFSPPQNAGRTVDASTQDSGDVVGLTPAVGYRDEEASRESLPKEQPTLDQRAPSALWAQAETHTEQRQFAQAQHEWERVIAQEPMNPNPYLRLARAQVYLGAFDEAIVTARAILQLDADAKEAYVVLGEAFRLQDRWDEAQEAYQRAVEVEPSDVLSWFWLGWVSNKVRPVEEVRQIWREGFQQTHDVGVLVSLGRSYADPRQGREAMRALVEDAQRNSTRTEEVNWQHYKRVTEFDAHRVSERLLEANLEQMIAQVTGDGIGIGVITYLNFPADGLVNQTLRTVVARRPEAFLIDAARSFSSQLADPANGLLSSDGWHPNVHGYALLTRSVMDALVTSEMLHRSTWETMLR